MQIQEKKIADLDIQEYFGNPLPFVKGRTPFSDILSRLCFHRENEIVLDYRCFQYVYSIQCEEVIIQHIMNVMIHLLKSQHTLLFHVNMSSITLLHLEKYSSFIKRLSELLKTTFPDTLDTCFIYNAPFIFSSLFQLMSMIMDKKTLVKIKLIRDDN